MANKTLLFVFLTLFSDNIINGNLGPCEIAIVGIKGECMSVFDCQQLMSIVDKTNKTLDDKMLLKRSLCGIYNDAPAVCCPLQTAQPKQCYTPEGKPGKCLNLYSCPDMFDLLKPRPVPQNVMQFVQNSKCIDADHLSVCCGPIPKFDDVKKGSCVLTAFPPDPLNGCCGVDSSYTNKIYGGNTTTIDQYPWLAIAEFEKDNQVKLVDVGALISAKYVVGAASTAKAKVLGKLVRIRLGEYDTSHEGSDCTPVEGGGQDCTDGAISIPIETIIIHPMYNQRLRINNIALIRMVSAAPFTDFIRPICLPTVDRALSIKPVNFIAAGWGSVSYQQKTSDVRMHVSVPNVNISLCKQYYSSKKVMIEKGHLCAGGVANEDTCQGDATLMHKDASMYELSGIVNFGVTPCGQQDLPTVYTDVYYYNTWIRNNIVP